MGSATPSQSGDNEHKGIAVAGRPGPAPKTKDSCSGRVRASEGTNPCTRPSFATKNVFDVLQDLLESIGGSPGPQLDAADGQPEPIVQDLHQSLIELLERPEILSLHAVRRVRRERQLHLKVCALCGEVEKVFDVLVDTGAQVSLVKAGILPPQCLTDSRKPVRLKVANGQYMVGGRREAAIGLQFVNHCELSRPDLGKEIILQDGLGHDRWVRLHDGDGLRRSPGPSLNDPVPGRPVKRYPEPHDHGGVCTEGKTPGEAR